MKYNTMQAQQFYELSLYVDNVFNKLYKKLNARIREFEQPVTPDTIIFYQEKINEITEHTHKLLEEIKENYNIRIQ